VVRPVPGPFPTVLFLAQAPPETTIWDSVSGSLSSTDFWFQVVVLVFCAPIWLPILRALYREIDRSLRPEGGVFAREYTPREMEMIQEREEPRDPPLKSIPRVDAVTQAARARGAAPSRGSSAGAGGDSASRGRTGKTGRAIHSKRRSGF